MNSVRNLRQYPAGLPLLSEDLVEFHAARLLLLLKKCGKKGKIDGLTKLAKLDFFVRYPVFFARACKEFGEAQPKVERTIESNMVRHHYGPWDHRYYHVLAYLEAKQLISVTREKGKSFIFVLTEGGMAAAERLAATAAFQEQAALMQRVKEVLGDKKGTALKELVYRLFEREVADRKLGEVIDSDS